MLIKADKERDKRFFGPLRRIGVSNAEFSIGMGYHLCGRFLTETMLVGNPVLRRIREATHWQEILTIVENTLAGSPERYWAIARCADIFDWNS
jgi:hypothetical protein